MTLFNASASTWVTDGACFLPSGRGAAMRLHHSAILPLITCQTAEDSHFALRKQLISSPAAQC